MNSRYYPKINEAIKSIYNRRMKNVNHNILRDYYKELSDYILSLNNRLYSLLSIATYNGFSDKEDEKIIIPSIGIEFLMNSRLIHDDLILKNNYHGSEPSFHINFTNYHSRYNLQKMTAEDFGSNMGILGGNSSIYVGLEAFFFNEFNIDLNLKAIEYYEKLSHQISESMLIEIDIFNSQRYNISDYIKIITLKTGAIVEKSLLIGANYAGIKNKHKKLISEFGLNLGILFQIMVDFLCIFDKKFPINKLLNHHLRETRVPIFLFKTSNILNGNDLSHLRNKMERNYSKALITRDNILLLQEVGILESCEELMILYYEKVKDTFNKVKPLINDGEKEFFTDLIKTYIKPTFDRKYYSP